MAIYIKGVEMPKDGWIGLDIRINCDGTIDRHIGFGDYNLTKLQAIEVPEPHGRLIDADELVANMKSFYRDGLHIISGEEAISWVEEDAPTVIEGSE